MSVPITITGDMNVNLEQALDPEAVKYSTILSTYNIRQHVKTSTHRSGSLLDHVITPESAFPPDVLITDVGLSDHMLLSWSINMTPPSPTYVTITRRKWQHFDAGAFLAELSKSELCADSEPATDISADVDHLAAMFNSEIIGLLGKHAPVAEFTVRERAHQPWFDSECREARRKARRLAIDVVRPTLLVQRTSKPGARPFVRLGSYPIRRLLITGSPKLRRREQIGVMFGSQ